MTESEPVQNADRAASTISPELVRQVAEAVYRLMQRDLRIEHERQRRARGQNRIYQRGR